MALKNSSTFDFSDLSKYLRNILPADCYDAVSESVREVSKEAVSKLKKSSAAEFGAGPYAQGWRRRLEHNRLRVFATIYGDDPTYRLAHLLEYGHLTRNGTGRTYGSTPAYPHIEDVEKWAVNEAYERTVAKLVNLI